jgi:hypothetical protein
VVKLYLDPRDLLVTLENLVCRDLRAREVTEVKEEIWENAESQAKKAIVDPRVYPEMTVLEERQDRLVNQVCLAARESQAYLVLLDYKALQVQQELR